QYCEADSADSLTSHTMISKATWGLNLLTGFLLQLTVQLCRRPLNQSKATKITRCQT
ncbi:hypothetical protein JRQ81_018547, partial [Phrynocephalus forsythii]